MKKVTFVKSRVKSIFHAESHLGGFGERGAPNAVMNGCTLMESGGAFSQHFPHGAKTGAHFFGAEIAMSSRQVQRGSRRVGTSAKRLSRKRAKYPQARRAIVGVIWIPFVFLDRTRFYEDCLTTKFTKDTKRRLGSCATSL